MVAVDLESVSDPATAFSEHRGASCAFDFKKFKAVRLLGVSLSSLQNDDEPEQLGLPI